MNIAVVLFPGFDELDALGPYEVLANARSLGASLDVRLVSAGDYEQVRGSHGVVVGTADRLAAVEDVDLVLVPGGGWNDRAREGAWAEAERGELPKALAQLHRRGSAVASVCTGAGLLAAAGILEGRPATTHHRARDEVQERGAEVVEARVVDDGDVVTAGGVTSGLDLALWLVEREWGAKLAGRVADEMEYERRHSVQRSSNRTVPTRR